MCALAVSRSVICINAVYLIRYTRNILRRIKMNQMIGMKKKRTKVLLTGFFILMSCNKWTQHVHHLRLHPLLTQFNVEKKQANITRYQSSKSWSTAKIQKSVQVKIFYFGEQSDQLSLPRSLFTRR